MSGLDQRRLIMEDVEIIFRNFAGKEDQYNRAGDRNFSIRLPEDVAMAMAADGWNVKPLRQRDEDDPHMFHLPVSVSYKIKPPKIFMISSRGMTRLREDDVEMLDYVEIKKVDLSVNPSAWSVNGNSGIKAYLDSLYLTIEEDELELKYSDVPIAGEEYEK